jgi:twitching motility two-component system response regulator PilH
MSLFEQFRSIVGKKKDAKENPGIAPIPDTSLAEATEAPDRRQRERTNAREGTRVLIIDDSPTIVAALRKILRSAKYEVIEAGDAETGLELARSAQPELIFLDIVLPAMNGFAALRVMRKDPALTQIPVIMISGNEQATEEFYANRIGADDFMKKPFNRYEVFARVERLLDDARVPRRRQAAEA